MNSAVRIKKKKSLSVFEAGMLSEDKGHSVHHISPHLLLIPSLFSVLVLLPSASSCFPLAHFLGLLALVEAFPVDAKSHTANQGQDHDHNGSYSPHRHWGQSKGQVLEVCVKRTVL